MAAAQPTSFASLPHLELKHILATTDFSECSLNALRQAAAIARIHGSDLTLLHVIPPEPTLQRSLEPPTWEYQDIVRQAKRQMQTAEHEEILAGIPHELRVEGGSLKQVLLGVIENREISLIVSGTHGRTGIKKLLLGSTAEQIFRIATCPVLTIGPQLPSRLLTHGRFQSILFATDFSSASHRALPYAIALARESESRLTLLHIVEEGSMTAIYLHEQLVKDSQSRLEEWVAEQQLTGMNYELETVSGYAVDEILRMAETTQSDLIVIGAHRTGPFGAFASAHLPWTVAQAVACHAHCPVLTVGG